MKPTDLEIAIAQACRDGVRLALGLPITERASERVERRTRTMRRSGRGGAGTRDDAIDYNLYGVSNLSAANYLQTANPGGEAGVSGGFLFGTLVRLDSLVAANRTIAQRFNGSNAGWQSLISSGNLFYCYSPNNSSTPSAYVFNASDVGKIFLLWGLYNGAGNQIQALVNRGSWNAGAQVGYTPFAGPEGVGSLSGASPATGLTILANFNAQGVPSAAQLAAYADATRVLGDLPDTIGGATVTHLWSLKRELAGTTVVNGQIAPTQLADRVTAAANDALVRSTTGIDIHTDANAIRSIGPYSATDSYQTAAGGGIQGQNAGFHVVLDVWLTKVPTINEELAQCTNGGATTGWRLRTIAAALQCTIAGVNNSSAYTITSGDLNKRTRIILNKTATVVQLFINGVQAGADVAAATYNANTSIAMVLGQLGGAFFGSGYIECAVGGNVALSAGNVTTYNADLTQAPPTIAAVTLKRWTFETDIAAGVPGKMPAIIAERISGAAADQLVLVGGPMAVRIIDSTIDGRRTLGAQGFSDANGLACTVANPGVIGSSGGFTFSIRVRWDSVPTGNQVLAIAANAAGTTAWYLRSVGAALTCTVNSASSSYTIVATDLGQWITVQVVFTGSVVRLYVRGVQVGTDQASTFPVAASSWMRLGYYPSQGFTAGAISAAGGGNYVATLAEVQQQVADTDTTSRLAAIPGKTDHLWEMTTDALASGVDAVPATVLDRVGTDHLTRVNTNVSVSGNFTGITGFSTTVGAAGKQLQRAGGLGTVNNQSFWAVLAMRIDANTGITSRFRNPYCHYTTSPSRAGWDFTTTGTNNGNIAFEVGQAPGAVGVVSSIAAALGQVKVYVGVYDSVAAMVYLYVDGALAGSAACASYAAFTGLEFVGNGDASAFSYPADGTTVFAVGGGQGFVPTLAEIAAQSAAFQSTGTLPEITGKTTRLNNFKADIVAAGGNVPTKSVDSKASGDDLVVFGLQNLTLAQRTDRAWSYETAPINFGAKTFSASDSFSSATAYRGSGAGFVFGVYFTLDSQSVASASRILGGCINDTSNGGFNIYLTGTNTILIFTMLNAAGSGITSPSVVLGTSDVGKKILVLGVFDGAKVRIFAKRAETGTGTAAVGFSPSAAPFYIGRDQRAASPSPADAGLTVHGWLYGATVPTLAEIQAAHDAVLAADDIAVVPFKTDSLVSLTQDSRAAGSLPATTTDRIGAVSFTKNGAPALATSYARAAGW
jgi:hypothetical protein